MFCIKLCLSMTGYKMTVSRANENGAEKLPWPSDAQDRRLDIDVTVFLFDVSIILFIITVCSFFLLNVELGLCHVCQQPLLSDVHHVS